MTLFQLKSIAVATMVIDHVGMIFFPQTLIFRVIGRLSFPLFAWMIANGYSHTRDARRYLVRLLLFACISQVPFSLVHIGILHNPFFFNIFFSLSIGLGILMMFEALRDSKMRWVALVAMLFIGGMLPIEYGLYGVIMIILFYHTYTKPRDMIPVQLTWFCIALYLQAQYGVIGYISHTFSSVSIFQGISLAALPLISLYTQKQGTRRFKWAFYWVYPIHLGIFWLIAIGL